LVIKINGIMRKVKGLFLMMMAVALTACSSDDESAPLTVNALAGEYNPF
jgi:hypothetical protein